MKLDGMLFDKYEDKDVSVYATTETVEEFVKEFDIEFENIIGGDYDELVEEEDCLILSRCFDNNGNDYWILEPLILNGRQLYNECEIALIEKEIHEAINFKKINCDRFDLFEGVVTYVEDEDIESDFKVTIDKDDIDERMFQEIANIILDDLENLKDSECPYCVLRDYVKRIYAIGVKDANEKFSMILDALNENMSDYVNKALSLAKKEIDN